jgi:Domain of unknown function (DUF5615)
VPGILADENVIGLVEFLVREMQSPPWSDLWSDLHLSLLRFEDVGLAPGSSDADVWRVCQTHGHLLITANRNQDDPDSLEAIIRDKGRPNSLPVFTLSDLEQLRSNREYVTRVVHSEWL